MKFRPCIDIHNGKVKQIVGGSLKDAGDQAEENFVSGQDAAFYAAMYRDAGPERGTCDPSQRGGFALFSGHERTGAESAETYPGGLQLGGGVRPENAEEYLEGGASHVIVTSYVFRDGKISGKILRRWSGRQVGNVWCWI